MPADKQAWAERGDGKRLVLAKESVCLLHNDAKNPVLHFFNIFF
ncbi:hypothetical protein ACIQXW_10610 [Lysinibacillus sp. NPDC097162]